MIQGQILPVQSLDRFLRQAVETLPREAGLPEALKPLAYSDQELRVHEGRFMLAPAAFLKLASAAQITSDDVVLDVGCTTGYTTGLLSYCAQKVVGLEAFPELSERAQLYLDKRGMTNTTLVTGDPLAGAPEAGPYDVILVEGALEKVPQALVDQLKEGGRLVYYKKNGFGEISTAIRARKEGGKVFEEPLYHWQASCFQTSLEAHPPRVA